MAPEIILALSLGLIGGFIPGPVVTAVFTEIVRGGFRNSIRVILISLGVETLVALTTLWLTKFTQLNEDLLYGISIFGSIVLVYIATRLWKMRKVDSGVRQFFDFGKITLMILTNGMLWIYWFTVCIPQAVILEAKMPGGAYLFIVLVQVGWLISTTTAAWIFSRFRPLLSHPKIIPWMYRIFSLAFIFFAFMVSIKSIRWFLT